MSKYNQKTLDPEATAREKEIFYKFFKKSLPMSGTQKSLHELILDEIDPETLKAAMESNKSRRFRAY